MKTEKIKSEDHVCQQDITEILEICTTCRERAIVFAVLGDLAGIKEMLHTVACILSDRIVVAGNCLFRAAYFGNNFVSNKCLPLDMIICYSTISEIYKNALKKKEDAEQITNCEDCGKELSEQNGEEVYNLYECTYCSDCYDVHKSNDSYRE